MVTFGSHVGNHQFQPFLSGVYAGVIYFYFCGHCFCSWFLVLLFHCPCSCSNSKCWVTMFMILNHTFFPLCACSGKGYYSAIKLYANFVFMDYLLIFCFGSLEHLVFLIFLLFALQHIYWNILYRCCFKWIINSSVRSATLLCNIQFLWIHWCFIYSTFFSLECFWT